MMRTPGLVAALLFVLGASPSMATTIQFWYGHTGTVAAAIQTMCDEFNASSPVDKVQCVSQGAYEQTMRKTVAAYRAGRQPALVEIYDVGTADMMLSDAIYPMDEMTAIVGKRIDASIYADVVRRYYASSDGRLYSQPFGVSTLVLYANTARLAEVGVTSTPSTWEAFEDTARKLQAAGASCPAVSDFSPWKLFEQPAAVQGVPLASGANGRQGLSARYVFAGGPMNRWMHDVLRWRKAGLLRDVADTRTGSQTIAFADGECAMSIDSTGAMGVVMSIAKVRPLVGMMPVYAGAARYHTVIGGSSIWAMKGQDLASYRVAAAFLAFLREPRNQIAFALKTGYLPITRAAQAMLFATSDQRDIGLLPITAGVMSLNAPGNENSLGERLGFFSQFRSIWFEEVQHAFHGDKPMDDALLDAQTRGNALLERFEATYRDMRLP
ncbi:extracellular solute-binding protein [Paraburkholderia sp. WC7.3b]|uniref:sn-glycerol-3-phosphate-binding periplasmic protein UgpB n=1 Tax=Paraburkholderia podalyriae TaxID=1938811 RepID=A0ABR7Q1E6_9BURK|nr:extracellular solute-binding protein [Paraburkholderia podalyriae]